MHCLAQRFQDSLILKAADALLDARALKVLDCKGFACKASCKGFEVWKF